MRTGTLPPRILMLVVASWLMAGPLPADDDEKSNANCRGIPTEAQLKQYLRGAADPAPGRVGGLFEGTRMWGAVVNRDGEICAFVTSTDDPKDVWPGSQAIAKAKAYTANAFSNDMLPLSTARLYTFTQPGHSLWSLGASNLFESKYLAPTNGQGGGKNQIAGGMIFFGGGVPLYRGGKIIGGLGVSGDTSCADHEIAKRARALAGLNPPGGPLVDDIVYSVPPDPPSSVFTHPLCLTTFRNGIALGTETLAPPY